MAESATPTQPKARPLIGALLGIFLGLAIAVLIQQQGIWPLDKITVFLVPGVLGVVAMLLTRMGRAGAGATTAIALIITIPMIGWGATGIGEANEVGVLNGGCEVAAQSSVPDTTNVTDTSRQDPFSIDPAGSLQWVATSPVIFDDYPWEIWVEIGGAQIILDGEESQNNDGGSPANTGDVPNVEAYAAERGIDTSQLRGVYKVGGFASTCDGFGFVKLLSDPLETLASQIAAALALLALILLLVAIFSGRGGSMASAETAGMGDTERMVVDQSSPAGEGLGDASGAAAAGGVGGTAAGIRGDGEGDGGADDGDPSTDDDPPTV